MDLELDLDLHLDLDLDLDLDSNLGQVAVQTRLVHISVWKTQYSGNEV